jgi:hypothetical protein
VERYHKIHDLSAKQVDVANIARQVGRRRLLLVRYEKITLYRRNEMSYREQVSQWEQTVSSRMPHLSRPQAKVLALWSMTMIVVGSCGTTLVGAWLSCTVGGSEESWRQRLREWCYDAQDKKGAQRSEVVVCSCGSRRWCGSRVELVD